MPFYRRCISFPIKPITSGKEFERAWEVMGRNRRFVGSNCSTLLIDMNMAYFEIANDFLFLFNLF